MAKQTLKLFAMSGGHIILIFYTNGMAVFWQRPSNRGVECKWV